LRRAVVAREKASTWRALHETEALERWRELGGGRWILLDHFAASGRRYVLAMENRQDTASMRALTGREARAVEGIALGQSYKATAAALDVSESRAHQLVHRALAKLGLTDIADLVTCARSRGPRFWAQWPIGDQTLVALRYPIATADLMQALTPAEQAIAGGLLAGKSYSELAEERGSSRRTIANQAVALYAKLGVHGRLELVARLAG
jgi:DNA-binding NarL/FixJ family response regulator